MIKKDPKFKIGDIVRISNYKTIFPKGYVQEWSEDVFVIKKVKTMCGGQVLLVILMEKKLLELFTKKNYKKKKKDFRTEKLIKRKWGKLYVT